MVLWLALLGCAWASVCIVRAEERVMAPESGMVPANVKPLVRLPESADPGGLELRQGDGTPVDIEVDLMGAAEVRWALVSPRADLASGTSLSLTHGGRELAAYRLTAPTQLGPLEAPILIWAVYDGPGEHYERVPDLSFIDRSGPWGPTIALDLDLPRGTAWVEVQHDVSSEFADPGTVARDVSYDIRIGDAGCDPVTATLIPGRRTFVRARAVRSDGTRSAWSQTASVEVGNLDSHWPPDPPLPPATLLLSAWDMAWRFAASFAGFLAALLAWGGMVVARRIWRRRAKLALWDGGCVTALVARVRRWRAVGGCARPRPEVRVNAPPTGLKSG